MRFEHSYSMINQGVDTKLSEMGKNGWELVSATIGTDDFIHLFFKRPVEE